MKQVQGQLSSQYTKIRLYFHGFDQLQPQMNGSKMDLQAGNFAFLNKLTEFDPLPDQVHPYFQITQLPYLELPHSGDEFEIKGLD